MSLDSFKQILLKKSTDNPSLQTLITFIKDEVLVNKILESLEKMAAPHARSGVGANGGVVTTAGTLTNTDIKMLHDALSHHVAHYKSALKNNNRSVADAHLNKIIPMVHLATKLANHSGGRMSVDTVGPQAWEANITTEERNPATGRRMEETEGWRRRPMPKSRRIYTPKDYRYFEMPPHPQHNHIRDNEHPHRGGYPFEEIQIGNPSDIDNKKAYLHVPEIANTDSFTPHPFDAHPVNSIQDLTNSEFAKVSDKFENELGQWKDSPSYKKWTEDRKQTASADPESFKNRGSIKPEHHFTGVQLTKLPHHTGVISSEDAANLPEAQKLKFTNKVPGVGEGTGV